VSSCQARITDLDPVRGSPYRPAAANKAAHEGLTEDRTRSHVKKGQKLLALRAATTEDGTAALSRIRVELSATAHGWRKSRQDCPGMHSCADASITKARRFY